MNCQGKSSLHTRFLEGEIVEIIGFVLIMLFIGFIGLVTQWLLADVFMVPDSVAEPISQVAMVLSFLGLIIMVAWWLFKQETR